MTAPGPDGVVQRIRDGGGQAKAGVAGSLEFTLGRVAGALERREKRDLTLWQSIHTIAIRGPALNNLASASGVIDQPDQFGPHDGFWWDVSRLSAWGWTAGTVTVYLNDSSGLGEPLAVFNTPGQYTWGKKQLPLGPRDRLVVVAAGVTGSVFVAGAAAEVAAAAWPEYVM